VADIGAVIGGLKDRSYISKLSLQNNRFTGALPASMREFKRAGEVSLGSNAITGGLPYLGPDAASGHLGAESLATLDVSNNRLTGAISNVSCLPRLRSLYLSRNQVP
jgi:Leucine-rich repeat (LRR) protein